MSDKRRGNRDGSITQRSDGLWHARVELDGKRRSVYGKTRAAAQKKVRELVTAHEKGLPLPGERVTLERYLGDWLVFVKARVRPRTYVRYEQFARKHLVPSLGSLLLVKLTPDRLEQMYAEKIAAGLATQTVHHLHIMLGTALRRALRLGLVARVVTEVASPPRVEKTERPTLSAAKVRELLAAAEGDRLAALYVLATHTGAREGELLALRWRYVDLQTGTVQIAATLQRTRDGLTFAEPKTDRSRRTVQVGPEVVTALRRHRDRQSEERRKAGELWSDLDLVFPNEIGRPLEAGNFLRRSFWPLLDKIGLCKHEVTEEKRLRRGHEVTVTHTKLIPIMRFHDLRHSFATLALERNVHPAIVAATLGHARTSTTVDMYTHVQPGMTSEATSVVAELIAGKPRRKPSRKRRPSPTGVQTGVLM